MRHPSRFYQKGFIQQTAIYIPQDCTSGIASGHLDLNRGWSWQDQESLSTFTLVIPLTFHSNRTADLGHSSTRASNFHGSYLQLVFSQMKRTFSDGTSLNHTVFSKYIQIHDKYLLIPQGGIFQQVQACRRKFQLQMKHSNYSHSEDYLSKLL